MTRNQQILLIMSWARSFHGLHLDDCVMLAARVLDEDFDGSIADADPADVMRNMDKQYFKSQMSGEVSVPESGHVPTWEEYGFVRLPLRAQPGVLILSDDTIVDAATLSEEPLTLRSGGTIPVLPEAERSVVLPIVFADPVGIDQDGIDELVDNPPEVFEPQTHIEQVAVDSYNQIVVDNLANPRPPHDHSH